MVTTTPVLTWDRVPGAEKYDVQLSTSSAFSSTLVSVSGTVNHQYVPDSPAAEWPAVLAGPRQWLRRCLDARPPSLGTDSHLL